MPIKSDTIYSIPNLLVQAPELYETGPFVPWLSTKPGNIDTNTNYGLGSERNSTSLGVSTKL